MRQSNHTPVTFINADMGPHRLTTLRVQYDRIDALGGPPEAGDLIVDLGGDRLLPGLINAHDHLQLNSLPPIDYGRRYRNANEWIADFNTRIATDRQFKTRKAVPRDERLALGGLKNILSGVTTVAHHDPYYPLLSSPNFPTSVVVDSGWSHSLGIDGEASVRNSYRGTPTGWPWMVHAAEGVDEQSASEFERLDALGCLGANTLLVHGVALDGAQRARLDAAAAGLIWCPASNLRLFGRTAEVVDLVECGRVALGSDSRLTGARDLLDELRVARELSGFDEPTLEALVTSDSARLLRLSDRGVLRVGARADILILPARMPLSRADRKDIRLVMLDGSMRYGDPDYAELVMPEAQRVEVSVDGRAKVVESRLGALLSGPNALEPGIELPDAAWRVA